MSAVPSVRPRPLHFAAFVMNTTGHIIQGTWRRPAARQADFNDLEHWAGWIKDLVPDRPATLRDVANYTATNGALEDRP